MDLIIVENDGAEVHADVTIRVPATKGHEKADAQEPAAAARRGEREKEKTYQHLYSNEAREEKFLPLGFETFGRTTFGTEKYLKHLASNSIAGRFVPKKQAIATSNSANTTSSSTDALNKQPEEKQKETRKKDDKKKDADDDDDDDKLSTYQLMLRGIVLQRWRLLLSSRIQNGNAFIILSQSSPYQKYWDTVGKHNDQPLI